MEFCILEAGKEQPDRVALRQNGQSYTFGELARLTEQRIRSLRQDDAMPAPGRAYVLEGKNDLQTLITVYALLQEHIPMLMLHPKLTLSERQALLRSVHSINQALPKDAAAVLFTSGTTGLPKPAVITRTMLRESAVASEKNLGWSDDDCWQMCMSVTRVGGLSILTRCLRARKTLAVTPLFDVDSFIDALHTDRVTMTSIVPTMLSKILQKYPDWTAPKHLRVILLGGSSAPRSLLQEASQRGLPICSTYGMTEQCSHVVMTPYQDRYACHVNSGRVLEGVKIRIVNSEIQIKGPMTTPGYWGRPWEATDRWFKTGDLGEFTPQGELCVKARRHDLIVSGGENVYPIEVENVLMSSPLIAQALVIGREHEVWGDVVCALIVPEKGVEVTLADVRDWAWEHLSSYKCPRYVALVDMLPVNAADKPDRSRSVLRNYDLQVIHYKQNK